MILTMLYETESRVCGAAKEESAQDTYTSVAYIQNRNNWI